MKKIISLSLILLVIISTGCKKQKLTKDDWRVSQAIDLETNEDITSDYAGEIWQFEKDGTFRENGTVKGNWAFTSKKEYLTITKINNGNIDNFKILKLKKNEMWLEDVGNEELHLIK
jgi:hypothetical protein